MKLRLLLSCLALLLSTQAYSAPWYQLELVLFAYTNEAAIDNETWPQELAPIKATEVNNLAWWIEPHSDKNALPLALFGFEHAPEVLWPAPLKPLADSELTLSEAAERISKHPNMQLISHVAWIEAVQDEINKSIHPVDREVDLTDTLKLTLSGSFNLQRRRYLHFYTDLVAQYSKLNDDDEWQPVRAAHIQQARRMRSSELHYIDHPMLGILVRAIPIMD